MFSAQSGVKNGEQLLGLTGNNFSIEILLHLDNLDRLHVKTVYLCVYCGFIVKTGGPVSKFTCRSENKHILKIGIFFNFVEIRLQ